MATSSSEEGSIAPKDFQQLSSSSESGSRLSPNRRKCPLCSKFKKTFHCRDCIHSGLFISSNSKSTDRYIDKKKILLELEDKRKSLEKKCMRYLEVKQKADTLKSKIRAAKDRNKLLKLAIDEKNQNYTIVTGKLEHLIENNAGRKKNLPKYEQKVSQIESYVITKREKLQVRQVQYEHRQQEIKTYVKLRLQQLFKYIFPIVQITPPVELESSEPDMVNALAEASQTTYIRNRWEYTDYTSEMQYSIVAPNLPASGNYSAYNILMNQNRDAEVASSSSVSTERNPAISISAALSLTAQCVHVLSFYLNVRLPHKMLYIDFNNTHMTEQQFARKVARLNANILYLCFSQNVDLCTLRSSETIHNILRLFEEGNADLGRQGPIEVDSAQASALEDTITKDLQINEDSDSEEGDSFPGEWEAVPHVSCPEATSGALTMQSTQMITTQQASSMAGGLVTSAAASLASFFKGFTSR